MWIDDILSVEGLRKTKSDSFCWLFLPDCLWARALLIFLSWTVYTIESLGLRPLNWNYTISSGSPLSLLLMNTIIVFTKGYACLKGDLTGSALYFWVCLMKRENRSQTWANLSFPVFYYPGKRCTYYKMAFRSQRSTTQWSCFNSTYSNLGRIT